MNTHQKSFCCFLMFLAILAAGAAWAADYVDIGDPMSEAGHAMTSWGPIEPATSGGNYGGIDHCRAIWTASDNSRNATITMTFGGGGEQVAFKHLEGLADDGFEVYIDGVLQYTHTETTTTEMWFNSGFMTTQSAGPHVLEFVATGTAWASWATYGQVCIAEIWVSDGPVPEETDSWGQVKALFR